MGYENDTVFAVDCAKYNKLEQIFFETTSR